MSLASCAGRGPTVRSDVSFPGACGAAVELTECVLPFDCDLRSTRQGVTWGTKQCPTWSSWSPTPRSCTATPSTSCTGRWSLTSPRCVYLWASLLVLMEWCHVSENIFYLGCFVLVLYRELKTFHKKVIYMFIFGQKKINVKCLLGLTKNVTKEHHILHG